MLDKPTINCGRPTCKLVSSEHRLGFSETKDLVDLIPGALFRFHDNGQCLLFCQGRDCLTVIKIDVRHTHPTGVPGGGANTMTTLGGGGSASVSTVSMVGFKPTNGLGGTMAGVARHG